MFLPIALSLVVPESRYGQTGASRLALATAINCSSLAKLVVEVLTVEPLTSMKPLPSSIVAVNVPL